MAMARRSVFYLQTMVDNIDDPVKTKSYLSSLERRYMTSQQRRAANTHPIWASLLKTKFDKLARKAARERARAQYARIAAIQAVADEDLISATDITEQASQG